jgi:hypothetical protein
MSETLPTPPETTQPLMAPGWRRGCGLTIMILGILVTAASGLCTAAMTVDQMGSHGGGEINLDGIQYIIGGPVILVGALMWWGGWAMSRKKQPEPPQDPDGTKNES